MHELSAGTLLIAEPFLKDPNFMRTVVLLCEHQDEGSFGFVLNKDFQHTLEEFVPELSGTNIPVYLGGPVQADTLHFLHSCPEQIPGGVEVVDGIYWGGDFEMVKTFLQTETIDLKRIRFFLGYSGWGSNQLVEEMKGKSWITAKAQQRIVFHKKTDEIWKESLKLLGDDYAIMTNFPTDPQLN